MQAFLLIVNWWFQHKPKYNQNKNFSNYQNIIINKILKSNFWFTLIRYYVQNYICKICKKNIWNHLPKLGRRRGWRTSKLNTWCFWLLLLLVGLIIPIDMIKLTFSWSVHYLYELIIMELDPRTQLSPRFTKTEHCIYCFLIIFRIAISCIYFSFRLWWIPTLT